MADLKSDPKINLFSPYSESVNGSKNKYLYVLLTNGASKERVYYYGEDENIESPKFPFDWSSDHFEVSSTSYSLEMSSFQADDLETLALFQGWVVELEDRTYQIPGFGSSP